MGKREEEIKILKRKDREKAITILKKETGRGNSNM